MFHHESWKPIYFAVKRSSLLGTKNLCQFPDIMQYCHWLHTKAMLGFPCCSAPLFIWKRTSSLLFRQQRTNIKVGDVPFMGVQWMRSMSNCTDWHCERGKSISHPSGSWCNQLAHIHLDSGVYLTGFVVHVVPAPVKEKYLWNSCRQYSYAVPVANQQSENTQQHLCQSHSRTLSFLHLQSDCYGIVCCTLIHQLSDTSHLNHYAAI